MNNWRLGHLSVSATGSGRVADEVRAELSEMLPESDRAPGLTYEFRDTLERLPSDRTGSVAVSTGALTIEAPGFEALVRGEAPFRTIQIAVDEGFPAPGSYLRYLARMRDWNFLSDTQIVAKNFMYSLFDWTSQLAQLDHGQSYLHASTMARGDKGLAIMGWGGVGKTTAALKLVLEQDWKFLSDDLGLIDRAGMMHPTPKRMQIYGYNLVGQPAIARALMRRRSLGDRASWAWRMRRYGGKRVRRRIAAPTMFGSENIGSPAPLTDLVFLQRSDGAERKILEIDPRTTAQRMASIVMAEIDPYTNLVREAEATDCHALPPPHLIQARIAEILEQAFSTANCHQIHVERGCGPDDLVDRIGQLVR